MEYLLILTATIRPERPGLVSRADPGERLQQYKDGLQFWLKLHDSRIKNILFLENSGSDLSELQALAKGQPIPVEFLSIKTEPLPANFHYGYSEMELISKGLDRSSFTQQTTHIIKATGRLTFPDISRLLDSLPADFDAAVDSRRRRRFVVTGRRQEFTSTQLQVYSLPFYNKHLKEAYRELGPIPGDPCLIENLIYKKLCPLNGDPKIIMRWKVNAEPEGIAAHTGKNYSKPSQKIPKGARAILRRVLPNYWM
jgi:hypothetical protein